MRLLNVRDCTLHTFYGDSIPPYAILSHTWLRDDEEVTFAAITEPASRLHEDKWRRLPGAKKILYTCKQASDDGLRWAWIDTCCIDKTNSVELSEAINSMFRWYQRSVTCYAYLVDVKGQTERRIARSRWWDRAWTLQELVAPRVVHFYDRHWKSLGTKADLTELISSRSNIDAETLEHPETMYIKSVAQRMSWAAHRQATRIEDEAYSLLGIFEVTLTMQYGEGSLAFMRLQEMILQKSNDQTLFVWDFAPDPIEETLERMPNSKRYGGISDDYEDENYFLPWHANGMFADSPARFADVGKILFHSTHALASHTGELNGALRMSLLLGSISDCPKLSLGRWGYIDDRRLIGVLPCVHVERPGSLIGILLEEWTPGRFRRAEIIPSVYSFLMDCHTIPKLEERSVWIDNHVWITRHQHGLERADKFHRTVRVELKVPTKYYRFVVVSKYWTGDDGGLVLEQYHYPRTPAYLEVGLYRRGREASDVITITIQLSEFKEESSDLRNDRIGLIKKADVDHGPWIKDDEFEAEAMGRTAVLEDIHVQIETWQVHHHLISRLKIEHQPEPDPELFGTSNPDDEVVPPSSSDLRS